LTCSGSFRCHEVDCSSTRRVNASGIFAGRAKAKAIFRAASELFERVRLIIIDEGHLVDASDRLIRNELFVDHLRAFARISGARILLLSAVLPNSGELVEWVTHFRRGMKILLDLGTRDCGATAGAMFPGNFSTVGFYG
jgi:hypothetical protein